MGGYWRIGDGKNVKIWLDPWLPYQNGLVLWTTPNNLDPQATVSELMNEEGDDWNRNLINSVFLPFEAQQITEIHIPRSAQTDKFIWKRAKDGEFRVKLAYHEIKLQHQQQSDNSSGVREGDSTWKEIWRTKALPSTLNFLWRLTHSALPILKNLSRRGLCVVPICNCCWEKEETEVHIVKDCPYAKRLWFASPLTLRVENNASDLREWIKEMLRNLDSKNRSLFCILLNQPWKARNHMIFEGTSTPIDEVINKAIGLCDDYWKAQEKEEERKATATNQNQLKENWEAQSTSMIKINVDAAVVDCINGGMVGVVARDEMGHILACCTKAIPFNLEAHQAEALAAIYGIEFALDCCFF